MVQTADGNEVSAIAGSAARTIQKRKPRGSYSKYAERRQSILDAALKVFATHGYSSGSMREVALQVGLSEPGMLHYFSSKSDLLSAVLELRVQHSRVFVSDDDPDGHKALNGLVRLAVHNATEPGVVELFCKLAAEAAAVDHPAHEYFVQRYRRIHDDYTRAFTAVAKNGELVDGYTPASAAHMTVAILDGLQVQWLLDRSSVDMAVELHTFLDHLVLFPLDPVAIDQV
jgi:AcrR family transcriptional regulator